MNMVTMNVLYYNDSSLHYIHLYTIRVVKYSF